MKKFVSIIMISSAVFLLAACQATPEEPIAVKKDMERMIDQADAQENGLKLADIDIPTDRYTFESTGLNGRMHITVDAEIQRPSNDEIPIIRVSKGGFSQELVSSIFAYLFPNEKPFDISGKVDTKDDIERILLAHQLRLADGSYATDFGYTEEEFRDIISYWEKEYATAPDAAPEIIRSDGMMRLGPLEGVGMYYELNVSTSWERENEGNAIQKFIVSTADPASRTSVASGFGDHLYYVFNPASARITDYSTFVGRTDNAGLLDSVNEKLTISLTEAKELCESFFAAGDLSTQYYLASSFLVNDRSTGLVDNIPKDSLESSTENYAYKLYYARMIDGIPTFVNADWSLSDFGFSIPWSYESICFIIDNNGVRNISWHNPIDVGETILESSTLKSFDEIISIFEVMIKTKYEAMINTYLGDQGQMEIAVDAIQLCLMRVREQNSEGADGLLIPAWVFYGNNKAIYADGMVGYNKFGGSGSVIPKEPIPLLVINAIDGSIIDLSRGY